MKFISVVLVFISLNCFSQAEGTGIWAKVLKRQTIKDTNRVNLLNKYAVQLFDENPTEALRLLKESEILSEDLDFQKGKVPVYLLLGKIYSNNKEYEKAIRYASEGSALANKYNLAAYRKELFLLLAALHYDQNESRKDSLLLEETRDIKAEIKYKYFLKDSLDISQEKAGKLKGQIELKDSQLILSRLEKYLWIIGFTALGIFSAFVFVLLNNRKIKANNHQLMTEQKLLRSQMNPHFIFNSVQNIRSLISSGKDREAIDYLNKFAILTRQVLETSNENYISLAEELELIDNYISLQQLLYHHSFRYTVVIDDTVDTDSVFIPPMLTQPFIENAIKHGLADKVLNATLIIRFYLNGNSLFFEVTDNGNGFVTKHAKTSHKSLAIAITKQRLSYYNKFKKADFKIQNLHDEDKKIVGAKVTFEIPYIYEN